MNCLAVSAILLYVHLIFLHVPNILLNFPIMFVYVPMSSTCSYSLLYAFLCFHIISYWFPILVNNTPMISFALLSLSCAIPIVSYVCLIFLIGVRIVSHYLRIVASSF